MHQTFTETFSFAFLGGVLPALIWLFLWLLEDEKHPEPKRRIFKAFAAGALLVPVALLIERIIAEFLGYSATNQLGNLDFSFPALLAFAAVEESVKLAAAYLSSFRHNKDFDEPVDTMIYLISAALGFAAFENALFVERGLTLHFGVNLLVYSGSLRFVGATLLHVVSSGLLGGFLAYTFWKKRHTTAIATGLGSVILLHAVFNFFILKGGEGVVTILTFAFLWFITFILIGVFQKIKHLKHIS